MKPIAEIEHPEVQAYARQAVEFVSGFRWCGSITECSLDFAVAGILGVFRVDLVPLAGADPTVWAVVGDVPPAYLAYEPGDSWQDALRGYVDEMREWVDAVRSGGDLSDVIPVDVAPTLEHANMLSSRLEFIDRNLLDVPEDSLEGDG
jgi:hypothetical protein